jgi:two-component system, NtrC family, response regulator AtoC
MVGVATDTRDSSQTEKKSPAVRVLVVDDEALIRWSVTETLLGSGYDVVEAGDGAGAVRAIGQRTTPIDVVLLDYRLPDSNDLKLLSRLRQLSPSTQVILMTAFGTPEVAKGALDLGAYRVVHKPFEMHELEGLVRQAYASRFH